MTEAQSERHVWRFFRAGGFDQVRLDNGRDVAELGLLDQKLWVALACPTRGIEFDERTLDLIDSDKDGRIRAPEIVAAATWTTSLLRNVDDLIKSGDTMPLDAIEDATQEGRELRVSAETILRMLDKDNASEITLQDTADVEHIYDGTDFNGDGIIPADAAEDDAAARQALQDIIDCIGAETDRSGKPGVSQPAADRFFAEIASYMTWRGEAEANADAILPLGADTEAASVALAAITEKLDDYFMRCRLAAYDARAADALNPPMARYEALAPLSLNLEHADIATLPIAHIDADLPLSLTEGSNPAWTALLDRFRREIVLPLFGERASLAESDWEEIKARFAPYRLWAALKPATAVEVLGIPRIRELATAGLKPRIDALIARDKALEPQMNAISQVEKLIRFRRDLLPLLNNVVSFRDFYRRTGKAVFQAGTLYLDARSCDLCVRVDDELAHGQLASLSRIYLAYCRCTRNGGAEKMTIAAAFTSGGSDSLIVGRNGVFYDRKGRDWDATIIRIIEHPISIRQAFWLPYQQFARFVGTQVHKLAAARAQANQARAATTVVRLDADGTPPPKEPMFDAAKFAGIFAAIGLAIGALGTAVASVMTGFLNLTWWQMPLCVLGIILVISGPSMLIATLKLRHRNLGPILDACGWAVNTRLRVNIPFGTALTALPQLPDHAERSLSDPYAEKKRPWPLYIGLAAGVVAVALLWRLGYLAAWLARL